jgi:hypothetical protein
VSELHTLIRLRGFGYGIVPHAPFELARIGDGPDEQVSFECAGRSARIDPRMPQVEETLSGIADVSGVQSPDQWLIEFGRWTVTWPTQFSLISPEEDDDAPFLLHGDHGLVWVSGPFSPPPTPTDLVAPGQQLVDQGELGRVNWYELHYAHGGVEWLQRHVVLPSGLVVTAQAPRSDAGLVIDTALAMTEQLVDQS